MKYADPILSYEQQKKKKGSPVVTKQANAVKAVIRPEKPTIVPQKKPQGKLPKEAASSNLNPHQLTPPNTSKNSSAPESNLREMTESSGSPSKRDDKLPLAKENDDLDE